MASADSAELRCLKAADEEPVSVVAESQETASAAIQGSQDKLPNSDANCEYNRRFFRVMLLRVKFVSCRCIRLKCNARKSAFLHLFISIDKCESYNFGTYCPSNEVFRLN